MKKFLLFISTLILSLIFINNKTYAQVSQPEIIKPEVVQPEKVQPEAVWDYPNSLIYKKLDYTSTQYLSEHTYTYEFFVYYRLDDVFDTSGIGFYDYYLITNLDARFQKGLHRNTFSYELVSFTRHSNYSTFQFRITLLKTFVHEMGYTPSSIITSEFFRHEVGMYIKYFADENSPDYHAGYNDGFDVGYDRGHSHGYTEGYMHGWFDGLDQADPMAYERGYNYGYDDGLKAATSKFQSNLDKWIVPAIIIVVVAGIFVGYRKERHWDD